MPGSSYQCEGYQCPFHPHCWKPRGCLQLSSLPCSSVVATAPRSVCYLHTHPLHKARLNAERLKRCSPVGFQLHQSNRRSRSRWALSPGTSGSTTTPPRTAWTRPATRSGNASKASRKSCSPCSGRSRRRPFEETTATPSTSE